MMFRAKKWDFCLFYNETSLFFLMNLHLEVKITIKFLMNGTISVLLG